MSIEAMKQALEALENNKRTHHYCEDSWYSCPKHEDGCANDSEGDECNCGADKANTEIDAAITSLRQAIEQLEKQEPVAVYQYRNPHCSDWYDGIPDHHDGHGPYEVRTLYTTPQQKEWVGLTDEEVTNFLKATWSPEVTPKHFIQAIEAKLKELNND